MIAKTAFFAGMSCLLAACSDKGEDPVSVQTAPIIKGVASDATQNEAVLIVHFDQAQPDQVGSCTGTLIAPNLVLTARHCVAQTDEGSLCKPDGTPITGAGGKVYATHKASSLYIFTGENRPVFTKGQPKIDGIGAKIFDTGSTTLCANDIALILLKEPVAGAKIAPIRLDGPVKQGEVLTAVGWGLTQKGAEAETRQTRADIPVVNVGPIVTEKGLGSGVAESEFEVGESICSGDSGGPALAASKVPNAPPVLVGVVSRGGNGQQPSQTNLAAACVGEETRNIYTQPFAFKELIDSAFAEAGYTPWLDGEPNPTLAKGGSDCSDPAACQSGSCIDSSGKQVCAPFDCKKEGCPAGNSCTTVDTKSVCQAETTTTTTSGCAVAMPTSSNLVPFGLGLLVAVVSLRGRGRKKNSLT